LIHEIVFKILLFLEDPKSPSPITTVLAKHLNKGAHLFMATVALLDHQPILILL